MTKQQIQASVKHYRHYFNQRLIRDFKGHHPDRKDVADDINIAQIGIHDPNIKSFKMLDKGCVAVQKNTIGYAISFIYKDHTKQTVFAGQVKI